MGGDFLDFWEAHFPHRGDTYYKIIFVVNSSTLVLPPRKTVCDLSLIVTLNNDLLSTKFISMGPFT